MYREIAYQVTPWPVGRPVGRRKAMLIGVASSRTPAIGTFPGDGFFVVAVLVIIAFIFIRMYGRGRK
jgi:hypothetical protein